METARYDYFLNYCKFDVNFNNGCVRLVLSSAYKIVRMIFSDGNSNISIITTTIIDPASATTTVINGSKMQ